MIIELITIKITITEAILAYNNDGSNNGTFKFKRNKNIFVKLILKRVKFSHSK